MFCQYCGKNTPENSYFCPYCGKQVIFYAQDATSGANYSPYQKAQKDKSTDMAIIGLVLSIASLVLVFKSGWSFFLAIAGIVLGIQSLKSEKRSMAIASIIISALSLLAMVGIGIIIFLFFMLFGSLGVSLPLWLV